MFRWTDPPDEVFPQGFARYQKRLLDSLYALCQQEAPLVEAWMRRNAVWDDDCMPGREYLKAEAFRDDGQLVVGVVAYYDTDLYIQNCPQQPFPFGFAHELFTFSRAGVISIILPRRSPSVLGDYAPRFWDKVRSIL